MLTSACRPYHVVKKLQALVHSVHVRVLAQHQIVLMTGNDENDGRDIVETMDPFTPLIALATDIDDTERII